MKPQKGITPTHHFFGIEGFLVKLLLSSIILFFGTTISGYAQKTSETRWNARQFTKIIVEGEVASTIYLKSTQTDSIKVSVEIAGETYENMMPAMQEINGVLHLSLDYRPFFEKKDDKLAAHKVLSGEWYLLVPETYEVVIRSRQASLQFKGTYKRLEVALEKGWCHGKRFSGNAMIQTKEGNVTISALPGVMAEATSQHGTVTNELTSGGVFKMLVESKYGNIDLQKTQ